MKINDLLNDNMNPQAKLMLETRGLQTKWEKTGLLEGTSGIEKAHMSILLENQAKQLLDEASSTGTSTNSEQWAGVALPLVRRVFAEIAAKDFVSVQPMNLPSGLIFYLDFKYGNDRLGHSANDSLFGGTSDAKFGSTDSAVKGLYGQGRYAYTQKSGSLSFAGTFTTASWADVQFEPSLSASAAAEQIWRLSLVHGSNTGSVDLNAVRSFEPVVSNNTVLNTYSYAYNQGNPDTPSYYTVYFLSGSATIPADASVSLIHTKQPLPETRGDFEAGKAFGGAGTQSIDADIGIPEVNLVLNSEPIVAKTRKLKAVWTPEMAQDLNAYHSIDAEAELTALLSEYVSMEIDLEILDMLNESVLGVTTEAWSAKIGTEFTKTLGVSSSDVPTFTRVEDSSPNRTAYVKSTWFQTLGNKIQKVSNKIHQLTLRGGANFMVCSPDVATILESIPGYMVNTDGDQSKFAMGVSRVGSFANRFQVYKNPYMTDNVILMGFRGNNFLETGAVYAPYIPLIQTPLVYDPVNFTPRRGVMTRYAKKVIRPEYYGKVIIADIDSV
jgi:hypothetical protein